MALLEDSHSALVLSNGPGDPKMAPDTVKNLKRAFRLGRPIMGICLGNQVMALAAGFDTYKLKYGHRSQNQPAVETQEKRCYITSQNHGYAVQGDSGPQLWKVWFENANDGTVEGIAHRKKPFFAVQFHPEARQARLTRDSCSTGWSRYSDRGNEFDARGEGFVPYRG